MYLYPYASGRKMLILTINLIAKEVRMTTTKSAGAVVICLIKSVNGR